MWVSNKERSHAPEKLYRFGLLPEAAEKLARESAEAEATGRFPHGVSAFSFSTRSDAASANRQNVELRFTVIKTGANPFHFTIELPRPVTEEVAMTFNRLFGRV